MTQTPRVSVAVPLYNEEAVLPELLDRTRQVLDGLEGGPHEIVLVDDGSADGTFALIERAAADDQRIVGAALSRNFGHQAALGAALDLASGDVIVVMDGDLQDPPEEIPRFLEEYRKGCDVVYAIRAQRKEGLLLRTCYNLFYRLINALSNIDLPVGAGDFALLSRRVVDLLRTSPERHRYLRGLRTWVGFRQTGVVIEREARASGSSKYTIKKLFRLAFDGIFAFSVVPIRATFLLGAIAIASSIVYAGYSLYAKFFLDRSPPGFTALILTGVFLSGLQLLFLGIVGEYVGRIYEEVKQRPHYIIRAIVGRR